MAAIKRNSSSKYQNILRNIKMFSYCHNSISIASLYLVFYRPHIMYIKCIASISNVSRLCWLYQISTKPNNIIFSVSQSDSLAILRL